ncbi:MAG: DUF1295 domain-containing protein [Spirochaetales bacterium]|nr:DUF1295 domain-containing protein [Spirochaetales bacterium]
MNLIETALIILSVQVFCFIFAAAFKTDLLTDLSYGLTFALIAGINLRYVEPPASTVVQVAHYGSQLAVVVWGTRLALFLFYRIHKMGRDKRFDGRRENVLSFAMFWALQAISIGIIYAPVMLLSWQLENPKTLSFREDLAWPLVLVGLCLFLTGFLLEAVADQQKLSFYEKQKKSGEDKVRWMDQGLFSRARHPNYAGEILVWWGLWLVALPFLPLWLGALAISGPVWITILLLKISGIPLLEKSAQKKFGDDPAYQAYRARTRSLWPI